MAAIPIEAQVSTDQLLHAVEQLPPQEFAAFVDCIINLRAQRRAPHLDQEETALLLQINGGLDLGSQQRLDELAARRQDETITRAERGELIRLTNLVEQRDADRLAALGALTSLRRLPLDALMAALGIQSPPGA